MSKKNGADRAARREDPRRVTRSIAFDRELIAEVDAAADLWFRSNRSWVIEEALRHFLAHLRETRNSGKPIQPPDVEPIGRRNRVH